MIEPDLLECVASSESLDCNNDESGTVSVIAQGGVIPFEYSINGGPFQPGDVFTGLGVGSYTVTTQDANGCTTVCTIEVLEPEELSCTVSVMDSNDCSVDNGSIEVMPLGGTAPMSYALNGTAPQPGAIFTDLSPGDYNLLVTDANGCTTTCMASIIEPAMPACTIVDVQDATCNLGVDGSCLLYTSPSPRDATLSRMPSSA